MDSVKKIFDTLPIYVAVVDLFSLVYVYVFAYFFIYSCLRLFMFQIYVNITRQNLKSTF